MAERPTLVTNGDEDEGEETGAKRGISGVTVSVYLL